jgi:uncharacterized protein YmfQ (DUF2313 family)
MRTVLLDGDMQLLLSLVSYEHDWNHREAAVRSGNQQLVRLLLKSKVKTESWERYLVPAAAERGVPTSR